MPDDSDRIDIDALYTLNLEIGAKEDGGDKEWFKKRIAPAFGFQRANEKREVVDGVAYIGDLQESGPRNTKVESIHLYGNRAVVTCVVSMGVKNYHNVRLFIRRAPDWQW